MAMISTEMTLPLDVAEDILWRLPVKSLKRLEAVSKSLCSLIRSPDFIIAHYSYSKSSKASPLILIKHQPITQRRAIVSLLNSNPTTQTVDVVANFDIPSFTDLKATIVGYCNGILCLSDYLYRLLLWNPATKQFKILPLGRRELPIPIDAIGFGYDPQDNDYKVVVIGAFRGKYVRWGDHRHTQEVDRFTKRVALYDTTSNSWRNVECGSSCSLLSSNNCYIIDDGVDEKKQVYTTNGFCHLWAMVDDRQSIISFDLTNQAFITTPFPANDQGSMLFDFHYLSDINYGSVGTLHNRDKYYYDVWVLGEVGVYESWTKLYKIGPLYGVHPVYCVDDHLYPLQLSINGEFFFKKRYASSSFPTTTYSLVRYRHDTSKQETIDGLGRGYSFQIALYAESLVSL